MDTFYNLLRKRQHGALLRFFKLTTISFCLGIVHVHAGTASPAAHLKGNLMEITVSGNVQDEDGVGIPGVSIVLKGTTIGTATDVSGDYRLNVPDEQQAVLVFSSIGYLTKEVTIGNQTVIDLTLLPDVQSLEEVVVVGYGTVKKSDLTGSVASVDVEEAFNAPVTSVDQALQGRAAGVFVTSITGAPGVGATIRVRGGNSITAGNEPLYVIDGFVGGGDLSTISPNDIKSIEVLKDASATSIYGARGANGVILITTKQGRAGEPVINFKTSTGWQVVPDKIDVQNAREFAQYSNEGFTNLGSEPRYDLDNLPAVDTDWQELGYRNALISDNTFSVSNGGDNTQYYFAGNYFRQDGVMISNGLERYNLRVKLDHQLSDFFKFGVNLNYSRTLTDEPKFFASQLVTLSPLIPVFDENNEYSFTNEDGSVFQNPIAYAEQVTFDTKKDRFLANTFAEFQLLEGLTLKTTLGADIVTEKTNYYEPGTLPNRAVQGLGGYGSVNDENRSTLLNENTLSFNRSFGDDHSISAVAGFTVQTFQEESSFIAGDRLANDVTKFNALQFTAPEYRTIITGYDEWAILSYLGRINYSLKDRYLFTASFRRDGSSRLGENNKWANFPSAAVAWRLSEEPFIQQLGVFSDLKLRTSYGITGNQGIPTYASLATLSRRELIIDNSLQTGVVQGSLANPNIKWETTQQFDVGLNMGFFDNRLNIELDYFYKKTNDLLFNVEIPYATGFTTQLKNIGSLQNRGFEASVNALLVSKANFSWNLAFNVSTYRNKILDLGGNEAINTYRLPPLSRALTGQLIVGEPLGVFVGYETDGIDPVTGDLIVRDVSGDGAVDEEDQTIIGNANPSFFGGIQNTIAYKNLELSLFFQGTYGNDLYNTLLFGSSSVLINSYSSVREGRWTPENPAGATAVGAYNQNNIFRSNSTFIQDGSYLRLKTLQLSYLLPLGDNNVIKGLRLSFIGTNLLLIKDSSYLNYDPEASQFGTDDTLRGYDTVVYPTARSYMFGVDITF